MKLFNWFVIGSVLFLFYVAVKSGINGNIPMINTALIGIFFNVWVYDRVNSNGNR